MAQSTVAIQRVEKFLSRRRLLKKAGITDPTLRNYQSLRLIAHGIRKGRGRGKGVEALFPVETLKVIREIRRKSDNGISLAVQAKHAWFGVGFPGPAKMEYERLLDEVTPQLKSTPSRKELRAKLDTILESGLLGSEVHLMTMGEKPYVHFSVGDIIKPVVGQLAVTVDRAVNSGMALALGVIALEGAKYKSLDRIAEFQKDLAVESTEDQRADLRRELHMENEKLEQVEAELRKVEAR